MNPPNLILSPEPRGAVWNRAERDSCADRRTRRAGAAAPGNAVPWHRSVARRGLPRAVGLSSDPQFDSIPQEEGFPRRAQQAAPSAKRWQATALQTAPRLFALAAVLLTSTTLAFAQEPNHDDPAAELASFKVAPGFQVSLFASEKDGIIKPIAERFDRLGRLWVIGSTTYPQIQPGEVPNDYVKIVEDTDGDGKADKVTTFADGLLIPTGLEVDPDARGCWVSEGTKLWHLRDEDGDGKADKKEIVLRGFGTGDNHQNINSFRWSPGGELLMSQGLHGFARVETPEGIVKLDEAGYYRFQPKRQHLEAYWGGPADPQNPWGFVWDDWGALFVQAGNNGGLFDALPSAFVGGVAKRPPSIWENARGRKCSNPAFVGTAHFPPDWQGALIVPGYINNAVWTLRLTPNGSSWTARDSEPLITSTHGSFRPMGAEFAPDGSLYLIDWYNPIIGHYQASFRHPDRDKVHGRIWRVTAKDRPLVKPPEFLKKGYEAPVTDILAGLESDERFVREHARRLLGTMLAEKAIPAVYQWAKAKGTDRAWFDALCVHQWQDAPDEELLRVVTHAKEPRLQAYAAEVLVSWATRIDQFRANNPADSAPRLESQHASLTELSDRENLRVRLAAFVAAGNAIAKGAPAVARGLSWLNADGPKRDDAYILYAREQVLSRLRDAAPEVLANAVQNDPELRGLLNILAKPEANVATKADPKLAAMVADAVKQPLGSGHTTPESIAALAAETRTQGDAKRGHDIFRRAELACTACHRIGNEGGQIGPDLTNVGSAQPIDFIIGAVLEPQREIKEGFETLEIRTTDGRTFTGFRRPANPGEVSILDAATQREVHLKKSEVAGEKTLGSLMPTGLLDKLPRADQRDLFRYLSELGKQ